MTRRSCRQTAGSTSILWALMVLPLLVMVGAALDFSNRETGQRQIRNATDAAAIAAVRFAMTESDNPQAVSYAAKQLFRENLPGHWPRDSIVPQVSFTANSFVTVRADYDVPTTILGITGISSLKVSAESTAVYGPPRNLEIALVLDNSASMAGARMTNLKSAASNFVDSVVTNGSDRVKAAIVPFNNFVNVGLSNKYASWINVPAAYTDTPHWCPVDSAASAAAGCTSTSTTCYSDGNPHTCDTWSCPAGVDLVYDCASSTVTYDWYGCVLSRAPPLDVEDRSYSSNRIAGRLDFQAWGCPTPILPLTNSTSVLKNRISAMYPESETMIYEGLSWGYRVLSSGAPFTEGRDEAALAAAGGRKILILMSDGENSRSRHPFSSDHWDTDVALSNARTNAACDEIKDAGIDVYVIAVGVTDPATINLLRECANTPAQFFDIADSANLHAIFNGISAELREIALSK